MYSAAWKKRGQLLTRFATQIIKSQVNPNPRLVLILNTHLCLNVERDQAVRDQVVDGLEPLLSHKVFPVVVETEVPRLVPEPGVGMKEGTIWIEFLYYTSYLNEKYILQPHNKYCSILLKYKSAQTLWQIDPELGHRVICSSVDHNEPSARLNSITRSLTQNPTFPFLPTQTGTLVYEGVFMECNYNHGAGGGGGRERNWRRWKNDTAMNRINWPKTTFKSSQAPI